MGSDVNAAYAPIAERLFQFALPRGERLMEKLVPTSQVEFQFALPRGERLVVVQERDLLAGVSIRAPAWGATRTGRPPQPPLEVSIRAPAWGATGRLLTRTGRFSGFQFALPRGERPGRSLRVEEKKMFQFALPRGERPQRKSPLDLPTTFQFALPRGERRSLSIACARS